MKLDELGEDELLPLAGKGDEQDFWPRDERPEERAALLNAPPLWFYLLREGRACLGPIGGQIVAEVLVGLLEGDPESYLRRHADWKPDLPGTGGDFRMPDLLDFVESHE